MVDTATQSPERATTRIAHTFLAQTYGPDYRAGNTLAEVSKRAGVSPSTMAAALRSAGITAEDRLAGRDARMREVLDCGGTVAGVAASFGVTPQVVCKRLGVRRSLRPRHTEKAERVARAREMWEQGATIAETATALWCSRATVQSYRRELRARGDAPGNDSLAPGVHDKSCDGGQRAMDAALALARAAIERGRTRVVQLEVVPAWRIIVRTEDYVPYVFGSWADALRALQSWEAQP